jgi:fatty acid-binding protein DegV
MGNRLLKLLALLMALALLATGLALAEEGVQIDGAIEVYMIGTTIGCHSGPGTVAVYFFGKER